MSSITATISKQAKLLGTPWTAKHFKKALTKTLLVAQSDNEKYAPATSANSGPGVHYVRGQGTQLASGRNLGNSERMSTRWKTNVASSGIVGSLENNASYSIYVIGSRQARFHARRGWPNVPNYASDQRNVDRLGEVWSGSLFEDKGIR